jgi:uncharacterized protein (TIGR02001 family)
MTLSLCLATGARAQISAAVSAQSDYRFRGISLSDRQPVASLALAYDSPVGIYAGASAIGEVQDGRPVALGVIEYLGYATPRRNGVSWDIGINNQNLSEYTGKRLPLNYSEVYVGAIGDHLSVHLHYSPNYFRSDYDALYAEIDGTMKPAENWRLFAHLGTTAPVGPHSSGRKERYDLRAGVARQFGSLEIQAAITATSPDPPPLTPSGRTALVVGASWFF